MHYFIKESVSTIGATERYSFPRAFALSKPLPTPMVHDTELVTKQHLVVFGQVDICDIELVCR